jgi:UDP-glucose 4-epimerase
MAQYFPDVPRRRELERHESAFSTDKARRLLGYEPVHTWRHD